MTPIIYSYLTEINVGPTAPANNTQINFQDFPQLRDKIIYGVTAGSSTTLTISPQNKTVVTAGLAGIALTLLDDKQTQRIFQHPCTDLDPLLMGGFYREFKPFRINLVKSYILITNAAGINANESVIFNFYYADEPLPGRK